MPYPTQITPERILDRAAHLIEQHGAEQASLHRIAADLGVKPPSLYRYFASRSDLLRAVNLRTAEALIGAMRDAAAASETDGIERVVQIGVAYRLFAHAHPRTYTMAFGSDDPAQRPDPQTLATLAQQIQVAVAPVATATDSLTALRGLWALVHGWVLIELSDQFRRGGDLDAAYTTVLRAFTRGLGT